MSGTAVGLVIGLAYGAMIGVLAYRWYTRERAVIEAQTADLRENVRSLAREVYTLKHPAEATA